MPFREATVLVTVEREGVLSHKVVEPRRQVADHRSARRSATTAPTSSSRRLRCAGASIRKSPGALRLAEAHRSTRSATGSASSTKCPVERDTRPDCARRSREARLQARHGRDQGGPPRLPAQRQGDARARRPESARHRRASAIEVASTPTASPRRTARSRSPRSTKGCSSSWTTRSWNILDAHARRAPDRSVHGHRAGPRHRQAPLRQESGRRGRRRRARRRARALRHAAPVARPRAARRARDARRSTIPLNDSLIELPHRRGRARGRGRSSATGSTTVRTTQDLMLFSGLPPVVREQDEYSAHVHGAKRDRPAARAKFAWTVRDKPADDKCGEDARERARGGRARGERSEGHARSR